MGAEKEDNDIKARRRHHMTSSGVNRVLKVVVAILAVVVVLLLGILIVVQPAKGPTISIIPAVSADGHLRVTAPRVDDLVTSPVAVAGSVTGDGWYFEATFPVKILDGDGTVLGSGPAQAQSDWMTTGTVPFAASVSFAAPKYAIGTIVFAKDNPSGLPQNAGELRLPVRFR